MKFRFYKFYDLTSGESDTTILDYHTSVERIEHHIFETPSGTKYSMVGFKVFLQRYYQKYLINYYLPSLIFVMVSWVSFLIPSEIVPGRMALLITLLLVLINMFSAAVQQQPPSKELHSFQLSLSGVG